MVFNPTYQASDEANAFIMASDTVNYSNSNDIVFVDNQAESIRGQYTLLHSGDDEYYGTDFDSPGWDNVANGNRGNDYLEGWNNSRDYLRGGKDNDRINGGFSGNDMLFGDFGDDFVAGSSFGNNILRGGKGTDYLRGGNTRDLLIGDFGQDQLEGSGGSDFFLLRTDSNSEGFNNLTPNAAEADRILDFQADDFLVVSGVESSRDVSYVLNGNDIFIEVYTDNGPLYAGVIENAAGFPGLNQLIVGDTANTILAAADGNAEAFTNNPNLLNSFGI